MTTPGRVGGDSFTVDLSADERLLVVRFAEEHVFVSWAIVNGGLTHGRAVVWRYVDDHELGVGVDAEALMRTSIAGPSLAGAVGLMTSRALATYSDRRRSLGGIAARCIATVGMTNALRAGDPPAAGALEAGERHAGTINLLCHVSRPMRDEAMLEALGLAAEARAAVVLDAAVRSVRGGAPATGTGTDCIVIAAPIVDPSRQDDAIRFAGKHTVAGHLVGAVVSDAIADGVAHWRQEFP